MPSPAAILTDHQRQCRQANEDNINGKAFWEMIILSSDGPLLQTGSQYCQKFYVPPRVRLNVQLYKGYYKDRLCSDCDKSTAPRTRRHATKCPQEAISAAASTLLQRTIIPQLRDIYANSDNWCCDEGQERGLVDDRTTSSWTSLRLRLPTDDGDDGAYYKREDLFHDIRFFFIALDIEPQLPTFLGLSKMIWEEQNVKQELSTNRPASSSPAVAKVLPFTAAFLLDLSHFCGDFVCKWPLESILTLFTENHPGLRSNTHIRSATDGYTRKLTEAKAIALSADDTVKVYAAMETLNYFLRLTPLDFHTSPFNNTSHILWRLARNGDQASFLFIVDVLLAAHDRERSSVNSVNPSRAWVSHGLHKVFQNEALLSALLDNGMHRCLRVYADVVRRFHEPSQRVLTPKLDFIWERSKMQSALRGAIRSNSLEVLELLFDLHPLLLSQRQLCGGAALHLCADFGKVDTMCYLLKQQLATAEARAVELERRDALDFTPLHRAVQSCHVEVVKYLVEDAKANVNATAGKNQLSPLDVAIRFYATGVQLGPKNWRQSQRLTRASRNESLLKIMDILLATMLPQVSGNNGDDEPHHHHHHLQPETASRAACLACHLDCSEFFQSKPPQHGATSVPQLLRWLPSPKETMSHLWRSAATLATLLRAPASSGNEHFSPQSLREYLHSLKVCDDHTASQLRNGVVRLLIDVFPQTAGRLRFSAAFGGGNTLLHLLCRKPTTDIAWSSWENEAAAEVSNADFRILVGDKQLNTQSLVEDLLAAPCNADVNAMDNRNRQPLYLLCYSGGSFVESRHRSRLGDLIKLVILRGADLDCINGPRKLRPLTGLLERPFDHDFATARNLIQILLDALQFAKKNRTLSASTWSEVFDVNTPSSADGSTYLHDMWDCCRRQYNSMDSFLHTYIMQLDGARSLSVRSTAGRRFRPGGHQPIQSRCENRLRRLSYSTVTHLVENLHLDFHNAAMKQSFETFSAGQQAQFMKLVLTRDANNFSETLPI